jgi:hypothetical protein
MDDGSFYDGRDGGESRGGDFGAGRQGLRGKVNEDAADLSRGPAWPELHPLTADSGPDGYPIEALPGQIGAAVREVAEFTCCPVALAANSALAALSTSAQALANVRRGHGLEGPVSVNPLTVAPSGTRKSTADGHFTVAIENYDKAQEEKFKLELARYKATMRAWQAKCRGAENAIATEHKPSRDDTPTDRILWQINSRARGVFGAASCE